MKEGLPKILTNEKEDTEVLEQIAEKVLNEKGKFDVGELLREGEIQKVREYLLGAIDRLYDDGKISFDKAAEAYKHIGVSPERASELRQRRALRE